MVSVDRPRCCLARARRHGRHVRAHDERQELARDVAREHAPDGSSPAVQDDLGLNRDAVLSRMKSEGERLRE